LLLVKYVGESLQTRIHLFVGTLACALIEVLSAFGAQPGTVRLAK
jgi:hypothetical protein